MTTQTLPYQNATKLNHRQKQVAILMASGLSGVDAWQSVYLCDKSTAENMSHLVLTKNRAFKRYLDGLIERKRDIALAKTGELIMQPQEVKARLSELARANLVDFIDEDGKVRLTKDTPHHSAAKKYYRKTRKDRDGNNIETSEITLVDQIEALRELAKIHGLYAPSRHMIAQKVQFEVRLVEKAKSGSDDPVTASTDEGIVHDST